MGANPFQEALRTGLREIFEASEPALFGRLSGDILLAGFEAHHRLMQSWNAKLNLTRVVADAESAKKHFLESLVAGSLLRAEETRVLDLGSGAGFPGLPIGVAFPEKNLVLLEGDTRKSVFLKEASRKHSNISVLNERSDRFLTRNTAKFDCVVSRAVSWTDLSEVAVSLRCPCIWITSEEEFRKIQSPKFHVELSSALPGDAGVVLRMCHKEPS